jgi:hypothetical protein
MKLIVHPSLVLLALSFMAPTSIEGQTQGQRWRRVLLEDRAAATDASTRGDRWEHTYAADEAQLFGSFRYWSGSNVLIKDQDWRVRFPRPTELVAMGETLELPLTAALTTRSARANFAETWSFDAEVYELVNGEEVVVAAEKLELRRGQEQDNKTLRFTPGPNTAATFFVRVRHMAPRGPDRRKAWVTWQYTREGRVSNDNQNDPPTGTEDGTGTGQDGTGDDSGETGTGTGTGTGGNQGGTGTGGGTVTTVGGSGGGDTDRGSGRIIQADRYVVDPNQLIWVPIRLLRPAGVANMNYTVAYDASVVRVEGEPRPGNLIAGRAVFSGNASERGLIRLGFASTTGFDRDGTVAEIPFRAVGRAGTRTALDIEVQMVQDASGNTLPIERIDGSIEIRGSGLPPNTRVDPDDPSQYDCDGRVGLTVADAQCALDMSVGLRPTNLRVDIDRDGQVTSADARLILQAVLRGGRLR